MLLLTESGDILTTESGNQLSYLDYPVCDWPTLDEVKDELGITTTDDDAFIQRQINASANSIEKYCHRKIPFQYCQEEVRISDCDLMFGSKYRIQLSRFPLKEVTSCYSSVYNKNLSFYMDDHGLLCGDFNHKDTITVQYYGGLACPIPDDILDVFYQMVNDRYAAKGSVTSSGQIKSESIPGVMKIDYYQDSGDSSSSVYAPSNYAYALDPYRSMYV